MGSIFQALMELKKEMMKSRAKNITEYNVLCTLIAECYKQDKDPNDSIVVPHIKKFIENAKMILEHDPARLEPQVEIALLERFLPRQLTEEQVIAIIDEMDSTAGMKEIMAHFKQNYSGQYDGAMVSKIAKQASSK